MYNCSRNYIGKPDPKRGCYIKKTGGKPNACPLFRYISHAYDGGDTFPVSWWAYDLVDPIFFSAMTSTADGPTLPLTHPDNDTLRWHESLFASQTGGASWTKLLELDAGPSGYSSVEMLPNGSAAIEMGLAWEVHTGLLARSIHTAPERARGSHLAAVATASCTSAPAATRGVCTATSGTSWTLDAMRDQLAIVTLDA